MRGILLVTVIGLAVAAPLDTELAEIPEVDEAYPEEVPGLFEGDIDLQPGDNPMHRNAVADRRRTWHNGVVPYEIESNYPGVVQRVFRDAMHEISEKTKVNGKQCITFPPRHGEHAYVKFSHGRGCHTPVGFINRMSAVTIGSGCERKGTVMHELLHALGFWHEQSRTDRDNYITVHFDNIQTGHAGNFNKYKVGYIDLLGQPYDYGSIMHYGAYAFAKDRRKPVIVPKQSGVTIGQRTRLSDTDIKEIQLLYGCTTDPGHHTGSPITGYVTAAPGTLPPNHGGETCTFQTGFCSWTQSHSDHTDWRRWKGRTSSSHTGPSADHFGSTSNYYIYMEASGHTSQTAKLDSQSYRGGIHCMEFYYHMYGANIGYLSLNVKSGHHTSHLKRWTGNQGNSWHHFHANLNIHTSGTFKFEFEAHTGSGYHSDIAIDDVQIHSGHC